MSEGSDLQFERAEYETAPANAQCTECRRQLTNHYYDVNGRTVCEACRYTIESRPTAGSPAGRFVRASGAGFVAAAAGAFLYYAIAAISGYEFGLIAILVGYAVGAAVKWGSNARGGWLYQSLAIVLTYVAIVSTYIPPLIEGFRNAGAAQEAQAQDDQVADAGTATPSTPAAEDAAVAQPAALTTDTSVDEKPPLALALLVTAGIVLAIPFLAGFENIMGIIIIGIGLYEAWKLNRREALTITGPHAIARTPPVPASA